MVSRLKVNEIEATTGSTINVASGHVLVAPGHVLQVVHGTLSSSFTGTGTAGTFPLDNYFVLPGIEATITPKASNSKILITTSIYVGASSASSGYQSGAYQILKAGAILTDANGDAEGGRLGVAGMINDYFATATSQYRVMMLSGTHLDTNVGTTSAVTYQIRMRAYSSNTAMYVNRSQIFQNGGTDYDNVPQSTITLMEIAQ